MEASCGCHHIGRTLASFGHQVRLIPAQFVKRYVKSQKNDYRDAEAIAEAVQRPTMRVVPIKTEEQLDIQSVHRVRERLLGQRTSLVNQLRAFFLERGLIVRAGRAYLWRVLPHVLAQAEQTIGWLPILQLRNPGTPFMLRPVDVQAHGACTVDEQTSQIFVPTFGDSKQLRLTSS